MADLPPNAAETSPAPGPEEAGVTLAMELTSDGNAKATVVPSAERLARLGVAAGHPEPATTTFFMLKESDGGEAPASAGPGVKKAIKPARMVGRCMSWPPQKDSRRLPLPGSGGKRRASKSF